jgi:hypothetical protein
MSCAIDEISLRNADRSFSGTSFTTATPNKQHHMPSSNLLSNEN